MAAGLPMRAIINEATSSRWDRCLPASIQDAVGASNAVTHPWVWTPIASPMKAVSSPATTKAAPRRRSLNSAPAQTNTALTVSAVTMVCHQDVMVPEVVLMLADTVWASVN